MPTCAVMILLRSKRTQRFLAMGLLLQRILRQSIANCCQSKLVRKRRIVSGTKHEVGATEMRRPAVLVFLQFRDLILKLTAQAYETFCYLCSKYERHVYVCSYVAMKTSLHPLIARVKPWVIQSILIFYSMNRTLIKE